MMTITSPRLNLVNEGLQTRTSRGWSRAGAWGFLLPDFKFESFCHKLLEPRSPPCVKANSKHTKGNPEYPASLNKKKILIKRTNRLILGIGVRKCTDPRLHLVNEGL